MASSDKIISYSGEDLTNRNLVPKIGVVSWRQYLQKQVWWEIRVREGGHVRHHTNQLFGFAFQAAQAVDCPKRTEKFNKNYFVQWLYFTIRFQKSQIFLPVVDLWLASSIILYYKAHQSMQKFVTLFILRLKYFKRIKNSKLWRVRSSN